MATTTVAVPQIPWNPASIYNDPAYLAYRASLGLESDTAIARLRGAQDTARRAAALNLADLQQQGIQSRGNISGNYESRGLFRSGARLKSIAEQRAAEGRQAAGIAANTGGNVADLEYQIAQQRAAAGRQLAGSALDAAQRAQAAAGGLY